MAECDPPVTQRSPVVDVPAELAVLGFVDATEVGHGGFGAVYRCLQTSLDRTVAVKVLTADLDDENLNRFIREQRAMGRLSGHPNIVTVLQVGTTDSGLPFIVMPFHSRGTLGALVCEHGPLDWRSVLQLGVKLAGALETVHRAGVLHRDIKPANILITDYGDVQLTDFGIARITGAFETGTGLVTGTPAFTAPEVLAGAAPTVGSDLYGLGATLFCALTGHVAFERRRGESIVAQFLRISNQPVPQVGIGGIPEAFSDVVQAAMAKDPAQRPASADDFGARLCEIGRRAGVDVEKMAIRADGAADGLFVDIATAAPEAVPDVHGGPVTVPPTLATKFRPPRQSRRQVPRTRLIEALRAGERRMLTLIHAPTGYGKTTLAAQWTQELGMAGVTVAWLTIDETDNSPVWFLANLVEAVRRAGVPVAPALDEVLEERGDAAAQYVLTVLINGIDQWGEPVVLVVDDWHRITDDAVRHAFGFLLEHGSDNLRVIVTSRTRTGLPVSRLRVRGELNEIDVDALCFDEDEAQSFLVDVAGLPLADADVCDLCASTDGWVAGLQLASLSLRESDAPAEVISQISGRSRTIATFLAENVLNTIDPETLRFLLATSIPERICGSLASALSGDPHGQARLEEVESRDLFLRRIDDNGDWFRYHHLFADFLRRRLERDEPELVMTLHRRASEWLAAHEMTVEAVDHALLAGDTAAAVGLVEAGGRRMIENSQNATLLAMVDKLPSDAATANPGLQLLVARADIGLHRIADGRVALACFNEALDALPTADAARLRGTAAVWEGALRVHEDRADGLDELVGDVLAHPETYSPFVVSTAANVASFSALFRFDFEEVYRRQEWARRYHRQNIGPYAVRYGYALVGMAAFEQLDLARAEQCFQAARQAEREAGSGLHSRPVRIAGALLAELFYLRGEIDEARQLLAEDSEPDGEEGIVEIINARFVVGARLAMMAGDRDAAARLLDAGDAAAARLSAPRLGAAVENERVLMGLPGVVSPVGYDRRLATVAGPVGGIDEITAQLREDTAIRLLLVDPTTVERIDLACRWAQEWVDRVAGRGRQRALLRAQRTLVECLSTAGRTEAAKRVLGVVLDTCADVGMVRFPIDGGGRPVPLIVEVRDDWRRDASGASAWLVSFVDRVLGAVPKDQ